ncbi:MAG TPA: DUF6178 family protein [Vicinamibacterales bacterium]
MAKPQSLLVRLLNTPDLPAIVPRLQPEVLHRVIQSCGLEDSSEFVALATPAQLARVLDLDIWHARAPGADEELDADRFGLWIAVLMQSGPAVAAEKLTGLDVDLVAAGFTRHVVVFDRAAISSYTTLDGEHVEGRDTVRHGMSEIGAYAVEPKGTSAWEPIVDLLAFLGESHGEYFHRVMTECVRLSNGAREEDGFHNLLQDDEQDMFDLAADREARREQQGYVTPAQAHAFLTSARDVRLDAGHPPPSPIARAYFRSLEWAPAATGAVARDSGAIADFVEILREEGAFAPEPTALIGAGDGSASRLSFIQSHAASHPASAEELAYLANAIVAGCSIQGRPFTPREAGDASTAICNLGLENWPSHWPDRDLIAAFQVGWTILHRDVGLYVAERLIEVLGGIHCADRHIQLRLRGLRHQLIRHAGNREPWRVRGALDALLMVDARSWAALAALLDECPVAHAALGAAGQCSRTIDPSDFEFIAQSAQIEAVREFMASLPSVLRP